jgi:predicted nucleotidyltransferase
MISEIDETIQTIVERIVDAVQPETIILFGSHSSGLSRPDSDIDLLIIETAPFDGARSRLKGIGRVERAIGGISVPTDILVYSRDEVERFQHYANHVVARAMKEGKVLYDNR